VHEVVFWLCEWYLSQVDQKNHYFFDLQDYRNFPFFWVLEDYLHDFVAATISSCGEPLSWDPRPQWPLAIHDSLVQVAMDILDLSPNCKIKTIKILKKT